MSRRLRYQVAVSLDGFIARTDGSFDWIVMDPAIDFAAMYREFDVAVMGRKTHDVAGAMGDMLPSIETVVFSRTRPPSSSAGVLVTNEDPAAVVKMLKAQPGRDIWLYGGGALFRTLLDAGLVDTVELAVIPVLLGSGVPLLPPGASTTLVLNDQRVLPASGIVVLAYSIPGGVGPPPTIRFITSPEETPAAGRVGAKKRVLKPA
ncbi:MAG: dihydrofolate reductase family protein [Acidobacteriota bacterium]